MPRGRPRKKIVEEQPLEKIKEEEKVKKEEEVKKEPLKPKKIIFRI